MIQNSARTRQKHDRGHVFCFAFFLDPDNEGAVIIFGDVFTTKLFYHLWNEVIDTGFPVPQIKLYTQIPITHFQRSHRDFDKVIQQGHIPCPSGLKFRRRQAGALHTRLIIFRGIAGLRIKPGKIVHRDRRFFRIITDFLFIEIGKIRLFTLQLRDEVAHLKAPIAHMDITDYFVAQCPV